MKKPAPVDLSDLINPPADRKPVDLSKYLKPPKPPRKLLKHGEHAEEIVCFWSEYECTCCHRIYEQPTYGELMTRFGFYRGGKHVGNVYRPYCKEVHVDLPITTENRIFTIQGCKHCVAEQIESLQSGSREAS